MILVLIASVQNRTPTAQDQSLRNNVIRAFTVKKEIFLTTPVLSPQVTVLGQPVSSHASRWNFSWSIPLPERNPLFQIHLSRVLPLWQEELSPLTVFFPRTHRHRHTRIHMCKHNSYTFTYSEAHAHAHWQVRKQSHKRPIFMPLRLSALLDFLACSFCRFCRLSICPPHNSMLPGLWPDVSMNHRLPRFSSIHLLTCIPQKCELRL